MSMPEIIDNQVHMSTILDSRLIDMSLCCPMSVSLL